MEKRHPSWKDYILATALSALLIVVIFPLKTTVGFSGPYPLTIMLRYEIYGAAAGLMAGVVCLLLRKPFLPPLLAALLWVILLFLPAKYEVMLSALLGCGVLCWLASIPFLASLLSKL